jgi:hypothetical protein
VKARPNDPNDAAHRLIECPAFFAAMNSKSLTERFPSRLRAQVVQRYGEHAHTNTTRL